jgi:hypothetical protein
MLLTQAEREKFAAYLEQEAASDEAIIRQGQKMGMHESLLKQWRLQVLAATVVAKKLRSAESVQLGLGEVLDIMDDGPPK